MENLLIFLQVFFKYSYLWMALITVCGIIYLDTKKDKSEGKEEYLGLKIIGLYLLSAFGFKLRSSINIVIPLGFIIYYVFIKVQIKTNLDVKKKACIFGIIMLYIGYLNSFIYTSLEYRDKSIVVESLTLKNFRDEWEDIRDELKVDIGNEVLTNMEITSDTNGNIESMTWNIDDYINKNKYEIDYDKNKKQTKKLTFKVEEFKHNKDTKEVTQIQENSLSMFEIIDKINAIEFYDIINKDCKEYILHYDNNCNYNNYDEKSNNYYISGYDEKKNIYNIEKASKIHFPMYGNIITVKSIHDENIGNLFIDRNDYVENQIKGIKDITLFIEIIEKNSIIESKTLDIKSHSYKLKQLINSLEYYTWEEVGKEEFDNNEINIESYIKIKSKSGVIVELYNNSYVKYTYKGNVIIYKVGQHIFNDVKSSL